MKGIAVPSFMIIGYVWQILGKRARPILSRVKASFSLNHYLYQKSMKVFLQLFLVILLPVFFRYISEILCPYIPPCLSDKCGFCKFDEVHSFMKLTRYLLKNINTWFLKSDIVLVCLPVYFHLFQWWCVGEGSGAVKRSACLCTSGLCFCIIFIFLRFCRPTFIYN